MTVLQPGDQLVVTELSRLGRSLGQIVAILDALAKEPVSFIAIKENIRVEDKQDIQTKVMTTLFALFAELERDLISERTREGLARARSTGKKLGRPKGVNLQGNVPRPARPSWSKRNSGAGLDYDGARGERPSTYWWITPQGNVVQGQ